MRWPRFLTLWQHFKLERQGRVCTELENGKCEPAILMFVMKTDEPVSWDMDAMRKAPR